MKPILVIWKTPLVVGAGIQGFDTEHEARTFLERLIFKTVKATEPPEIEAWICRTIDYRTVPPQGEKAE
jgi:hypothetical protein